MLIIRQQLMDIDGISQLTLRQKDALECKEKSWDQMVKESQRKAMEYMRKMEAAK